MRLNCHSRLSCCSPHICTPLSHARLLLGYHTMMLHPLWPCIGYAACCGWLKANWHSLDGTLDPFVLLVAFTVSIFAIGERALRPVTFNFKLDNITQL